MHRAQASCHEVADAFEKTAWQLMTACDADLLLAAFAVASDLPVAALALQADPFGVDACC